MVMADDKEVPLGQAKAASDFIEWKGPAGTHEVECVDVTAKMGKKYQSNEDELKLTFAFVPVGFTGHGTLHVYANLSTHPKSNLSQVCAALGVPVPASGSDVYASTFIGGRCQALIEYVASTKRPGTYFPHIARLFPLVSTNGNAPVNGVDPDVGF
jgi:hypothetical protein